MPRFPAYSRPARSRARRGNAMILVAGILVLLVILATTFITRTQGGRATASAVRASQDTTFRADAIGEMLAQELAQALFVEPFAAGAGGGIGGGGAAPVRSANAPRLSPLLNQGVAAGRYGIDRAFPFNHAPYAVSPRTNWPDENIGGVALGLWPAGPGAPTGDALLWESNALGGPGVGDQRWLRATEPVRWSVTGVFTDANGNSYAQDDAFKYWPKLTNIARVNNGWRVCRDISNALNVVEDLDLPVEQWLVSVQPDNTRFNFNTGNAFVSPNANGFEFLWNDWLGNLQTYAAAFKDPLRIPPNLFDLNDLDGDGVRNEIGERRQDEFDALANGGLGSLRNRVSRRLADTDGDGFTDSFWFTAPTPVASGVRQVVAISVVDNSGLFNATTATRFDPVFTRGTTPSDVAAVGEQVPVLGFPPAPNANVGLFDNPHNSGTTVGSGEYPPPLIYGGTGINSVRWDPARWPNYLESLGLGNLDPLFALTTDYDRRQYWLFNASQPFESASSVAAANGIPPFAPWVVDVVPFGISDELELRAHNGNNSPFNLSRFERAVSPPNSDFQLLRSNPGFEETSELIGQPGPTALMHDIRRMITMHSGARNDELPPWLRWRWVDLATGNISVPPAVQGQGPDAVDRFLAQANRKVDLREQNAGNFTPPAGVLKLHERLPYMLLNVFSDGDEDQGQSYFGPYQDQANSAVDKLRRLASMYAANILAYRDFDERAPLFDETGFGGSGQAGAIPITDWDARSLPTDETVRFLGMEKQPFLVEAFVGHVYQATEVPGDPDGLGWLNSGQPLLLEEDDSGTPLQSTVTAVQIANPYPTPILLYDPVDPPVYQYEVEMFGRSVNLTEVAAIWGGGGRVELPPSRPDRPTTLTLYAMDKGLAGQDLRTQFRDFLDLEVTDHPQWNLPDNGDPGAILIDLKDLQYGTLTENWSTSRRDYDTATTGVRITRVYDTGIVGQVPIRVVVDRLDEPGDSRGRSFLDTVKGLASDRPPKYSELPAIPPPANPPFERHPTRQWDVATQGFQNWVQWVRATRAWGRDINDDGFANPAENNPRYVNAEKLVRFSPDTPTDPLTQVVDPRPGYVDRLFRKGVWLSLGRDPDAAPGDMNLPWFTMNYTTPLGGEALRKPTFFDFGRDELTEPDYAFSPDKGYTPAAQSYAMQMLQKDADFDQVGELYNVWAYCHELEFTAAVPPADPTYVRTVKTFSEYMKDGNALFGDDNDRFHGRIRTGRIMADGDDLNLADYRHAFPRMAAGTALLDAFVCDGPGFAYNPATNPRLTDFVRRNAADFSGRLTPGLVNLNTAPVEVLRTLPHWYKLVPVQAPGIARERYARSGVPESVISYRDRLENPTMSGIDRIGFWNGPDYSDRDNLDTQTRGIESLGQLRYVDKAGGRAVQLNTEAQDWDLYPNSWRMSFAAQDPFTVNQGAFTGGIPSGTWLSTDVIAAPENTGFLGACCFANDVCELQSAFDCRNGGGVYQGDGTYCADSGLCGFDPDNTTRDAEEANMLLAGASNLVTTRSDVFTVYFRVRSFKQNPISGRWDATDPEYILDDTRYVMLVDRSEVERPSDRPKILYMSRLP